MKKREIAKLGAIGLAAGVVNGFFGSAGGVVLVLCLGLFTQLEEKKIFATTVCVILVLSIISAFIYGNKTTIELEGVLPYLVGGSIGGIAGGIWFKKISMHWVKKAFAVLVIFVGIKGVLGF